MTYERNCLKYKNSFAANTGGEVAQSVEQRTENPRVHSSILCLATIFLSSNNPARYPKYPSCKYSGFFLETRQEKRNKSGKMRHMSNVVIIGTQWGDEGKGKIVDLLTEHADVIVRFQGGPNAGHTVVVGDKKTILHQVPSGILHQGKQCVIGNGVVLDAESLIKEIDEVKAQGYFSDDSVLHISENAHLIMPYHKLIDVAREKMKGEGKIGTTGRGIGPAYEDKVGRNGIRLADIFNDEVFLAKLNQNLKEKNFYLKNYLGEAEISCDAIFPVFTAFRKRLSSYVGNAALFLHDALAARKKVLFEGAQGAMLDVDHGTYPFVTSSNTASANAAIGSGVGPRHLDVIVGIVKAYTTRVGEGPFPTEQENDLGEKLRDKGDEYGATTGRPRRCGWLDLAVVQHAIRMNSITPSADYQA